jgi:hypothetical protein
LGRQSRQNFGLFNFVWTEQLVVVFAVLGGDLDFHFRRPILIILKRELERQRHTDRGLLPRLER